MTGWSAVVLAGARPGIDRFAAAHGTDLKALIPVAGEPMVRRPVRALLADDRIRGVTVLAQAPERIAAVLPADPRLTVGRSGSTIAETLEALCADPATQWPVLVTTADHALLDAAMIGDFVERAEGVDLAVGLVGQAALSARLPRTERTWTRLRGGAYSGANLFALGSPRVASAIALWSKVERDRKKGWRIFTILGPALLLGALLRARTLDQTVAALGRRLGLTMRAIEMRDPLAAVDVDKPADHALVEAILAGRS